MSAQPLYVLLTPAGPRTSRTPGALGGHRRLKVFGRLDCHSAVRAIGRGQYVRHRVFFASEVDARACGYRPCARCLPAEYRAWKVGQAA